MLAMAVGSALLAQPGAPRKKLLVIGEEKGYRHEEIASLLGVTTGTTKAQLHRARMLLRGHLEA